MSAGTPGGQSQSVVRAREVSEQKSQNKDVNKRYATGQTLLFHANLPMDWTPYYVKDFGPDVGPDLAVQATVGLIAELIRQGANAEVQDYLGLTPLIHHVAHGNAVAVLELIKHRADPNANDATGMTALMHAKEARFVGPLIEAGSNIHAKDSSGMTALMRTSFHGSFSAATILMEAGADPGETDTKQGTALDHAILGKKICQQFLERLGPNDWLFRETFPEPRHEETIKLLENSHSPEMSALVECLKVGRPALSVARNKAEAVALINAGDDVNAKDNLRLP